MIHPSACLIASAGCGKIVSIGKIGVFFSLFTLLTNCIVCVDNASMIAVIIYSTTSIFVTRFLFTLRYINFSQCFPLFIVVYQLSMLYYIVLYKKFFRFHCESCENALYIHAV